MPPATTFPATPKPEYVYDEEIEFNTLVSTFEGKMEQRRSKWATGRRSFRLVWKQLETSEIDVLWTFYIARKGRFEAFNFVNLNDNQTYICRFKEDKMSKSRFSTILFSTGLELLETNE